MAKFVRPADSVYLNFKNTFKANLNDYLDLLTGFDIVKFDDKVIHSGKNESMQDVIIRNHGQEAVSMIKYLMSFDTIEWEQGEQK